MAIGDKKSLLQPSSTQSQQFRLQFTNLQPTSLTAQQLSPVANARPAVSVFLNAPAPVSLQAPPTIPPALPAPVPAPTPVVSSVPIVYSDTAFYFDGNSIFSSSLEPVDFAFNLTGSNGISIAMAIKPFTWQPETVSGHPYTILHMYSGSEASQSLNISLYDNELRTTFSNNGQELVFSRILPVSSLGRLGNSYALVTLGYIPSYQSISDLTKATIWYGLDNQGNTVVRTSSTPAAVSASFTAMNRLYIGGTKFESGKNFIGNIAFVALKSDGFFGDVNTDKIFNKTYKPKDLAPLTNRVYTFGEPNGSSVAVETTGSIATKNVALTLSGSVFTNANYSYFAQ
jgi:hypothetical protein